MKSGRQIGSENIVRVTQWVEDRERMGDQADYRRGNKINRGAMADELGIARSVLTQNPAVRELVALADERWFGAPDPIEKAAAIDAARDRAQRTAQRTSNDNNKLIQRIAELQAENQALRERLGAFEMQKRIIESGDPGLRI